MLPLVGEEQFMPLYTFFPCRPDGQSLSFESHELTDDLAAEVFALAVLHRHPSSTSVAIWCGEREVGASSGERNDARVA